MAYISYYASPIGNILLAADGIGLTGLWFEGQKHYPVHLDKTHEEREVPLFEMAKNWLDVYFSGREPDLSVPLHFIGTTFQREVWKILCTIPYGQTMTYGQIAGQIAAVRGGLCLPDSVPVIAFSAEKHTGRDEVIREIFSEVGYRT